MYPQYPNQPNQPGSYPPNQYPVNPNAAPGSGPQPLRPDPYPPAPQQPSGPYGPPPAASYPPTQPSGLYPPPQPQPGQPGSFPSYPTPASGYAPYSGAPGVPFGAPPTNPLGGGYPPQPPQRSGNLLWVVIASVVTVVLIVALVGAGILLSHGNHGTSTQTNTSATQTVATTPTPAATPTANMPTGSDTFTDNIPTCDNPGVWNTASGTTVKCGASAVTVTNPLSSHTIAEIYFNVSGSFATSYDVAVQVAKIANGCGGVSVLEQQAASVVGYVCSDGSWTVVEYSAAGTPTTLLTGQPGTITVSGQINLDITVATRIYFSINGSRVGSVRHPPNEGTDSIGLVVTAFNSATAAASADFDTFQYSPQ